LFPRDPIADTELNLKTSFIVLEHVHTDDDYSATLLKNGQENLGTQ